MASAAEANNSNDENISVIQAYQDGETYNQVQDLLKGIVKQD